MPQLFPFSLNLKSSVFATVTLGALVAIAPTPAGATQASNFAGAFSPSTTSAALTKPSLGATGGINQPTTAGESVPDIELSRGGTLSDGQTTVFSPLTFSQGPISQTPSAVNNACSTSLSQRLWKVLNRPKVAAQGWGVLVVALNSNTTLFSHKPNSFFIPASNTKIFTTAAALESLGPAHQFGSKSLAEWVNVVNTYSNNRSADALLRRIGGTRTVQRELTKMGINPQHFRQRDGSGLSRGNRATPTTMVSALKAMSRSNHWAYFYHSLPSSGESGTLKRRLKAPFVKGKVRAKTGTLRGVRALSGYLDHKQYGPLVFSILVNQRSQPGSVLVSNIDSMVLNMALSRPCGRDARLFQ